MSLAAEARAAARERPFLLAAMRAGVVNYTAAADRLELDGDREAVATALRRFAEGLPAYETDAREARVTMTRGVGVREAADDEPLLSVGGASVVPDAGDATAVLASGDVDAAALATVLARCLAADVAPVAAGAADGALLVVVGRRDGVDALRVVESALDAVATPP